jgi:hypothetical protein
MVIGETFAWAHLPKTGGDATAAMFGAVAGLAQFADPFDSNDKHMPFWGREDAVAGKLLAMNFRRLPAWALSAAHHLATNGVHPDYVAQPLETADEIAAKWNGDSLLWWMTDHGRFEVDRWLRIESLEQDVIALLSELGALTADVEARVRAVGHRNTATYDRDLGRRFTPEQMRRLYESNRTWAEVERKVYGDLLTL